MPVKRCISNAKPYYSQTIERLIDCLEIEFSEPAKDELVAVAYFNEYPEFPDELRHRAMSVLSGWCDSRLKYNKCQ